MTALQAQYQTTTPAFKLTTAPTSGYQLADTDPNQFGARPLACYLQATTQNIRFTTDGVTTPTSSVGTLLVAGAAPFYYFGELNKLQFIQTTSGSVLNVIYAPVFDGPQGPPGSVDSVVAGTAISVDSSDPANPVVANTAPVPDGGTTGQVLTKASNTDQDTEWATSAGGSISVTDGSTTVDPATSIAFTGATVTDGGGGVAQVAVAGGSSVVLKSVVDILPADIVTLGTTPVEVIPALGAGVIAWVIKSFVQPIGVVGYSGLDYLEMKYKDQSATPIFNNATGGKCSGVGLIAGGLGVAEFGPVSALSAGNVISPVIFAANNPVTVKSNVPVSAVADGITAVVINNGGANYVVGDFCTVSGTGNTDADIIVTGVDGGGGITSLVLFDGGDGYTAGSNVALSSGSGTGATVDTTVGSSNVTARITTLYVPITLDPA